MKIKVIEYYIKPHHGMEMSKLRQGTIIDVDDFTGKAMIKNKEAVLYVEEAESITTKKVVNGILELKI